MFQKTGSSRIAAALAGFTKTVNKREKGILEITDEQNVIAEKVLNLEVEKVTLGLSQRRAQRALAALQQIVGEI